MKVTVDRDQLLRVLIPCAGVADADSPLYFGKCVLLSASLQALEIRAFKQPLSIRAIVRDHLDVSRQGTVVTMAPQFLEAVRWMPEGSVTLDATGPRFTITGQGKRKYQLGSADGRDFPAFPQMPAPMASLPSDPLLCVLRRTVYAALQKDFYIAFHGVELAAGANKMQMSSTDGKRFARAFEEAPGVDSAKTFLPLEMAKALADVLGSVESDKVMMACSDRLACFSARGVDLASSIPDGGGPPFEYVFSLLKAKEGIMVSRTGLQRAIKAIVVGGLGASAPVEVRAVGSSLYLRYVSEKGEEVEDEVDGAGRSAWTAILEAKYMLEALSRIDADDVEVMAEEEKDHPVVFRSDKDLTAIARIAPEGMRVVGKEAA